MTSDEQTLHSIIDMYNKGYDISKIIKSLPTEFCKKTERKSLVYTTIYQHLIKQKGSVKNAISNHSLS